MVLGVLSFVAALALTVTMCISRQRMLGWPSAGFWMIFSGYCYLQSNKLWPPGTDIYYYLFWMSAGMIFFSALASMGFRDVKDSEADTTSNETEPEDVAEGGYEDEGPEDGYDDGGDDGDSYGRQRKRSRRPSTKRTISRRLRWGAFK